MIYIFSKNDLPIEYRVFVEKINDFDFFIIPVNRQYQKVAYELIGKICDDFSYDSFCADDIEFYGIR